MSAQGSSEGKATLVRRVWRGARWGLLVLVVAYVGLVIWRTPVIEQQKQSAKTVALIQSQHLTLADVDGKHLPPAPDPKLVDASVAGVDANQNGIRDDVELAIFKKYPNSPYTRSAELQYAMTEQMFLTNVFDTKTWVVATQEKGRAYGCIFDATAGVLPTIQERTGEVENLIFNTEVRKQKLQEANQYRSSFSVLRGADCDIDAQTLDN